MSVSENVFFYPLLSDEEFLSLYLWRKKQIRFDRVMFNYLHLFQLLLKGKMKYSIIHSESYVLLLSIFV